MLRPRPLSPLSRPVLGVTMGGLLLAGGVAVAPPAAADERVCTSSIGAETVDDLRVPADTRCTLSGTRVEGTVVVERGATLTATDVRVDGNVQAEGARSVSVRGGSVGGSVQLEQGGGADVAAVRVEGDVQLSDNRDRLTATDNVVGGNVQAFANRGGLDVRGNRIDGNLQCQSNQPPPTGAGNVVAGSAEDQCAALTGAAPPPPPSSDRFCDTAGSVHRENIEKVADAGIADGYADGCFRPASAVTRGQVAAFLARGYALPDGPARFCDTAGTTHEAAIRAVAAAGITQGDGTGCFRPQDAVSRGQMAAFLARAEQLGGRTDVGFCDTAGTTHAASIGAVAAAGIAAGYQDGCFRPGAAVTRGQMATFLVRALGL